MIWVAATIGGLIGAAVGVLAVRRMDKRRSDEGVAPYADPGRKPPEYVKLRARRDIREDVWLERILQTDAKTAAVHLQLSMAQQLASELAPHVAVGYVFDQKARVYKVWGDARVLPLEEWK